MQMNDLSRRDFLKLSAAATASAALPFPGEPFAQPVQTDVLAHSLMFGISSLPRMRALFHQDAQFIVLKQNLQNVDRPAERQFLASEIRYNDQRSDLRRAGELAEKMAFLYLMTGDEDAADLAAECIRAIMRFERWDFVLEAGKYTIGVQRAPGTTTIVSLVSDWLGSRISKDERTLWLQTMAARGCAACYLSLYCIRYPQKTVGWGFDPTSTIYEQLPGNFTDFSRRPEITQTTNLRASPASGLATGTVALRSFFGPNDENNRWLKMAIYSLRAFQDIFKPDGSYHEGLNYANYTAELLCQAITVLQRSGDAELEDIVNWQGYADYLLNLSLPTRQDPYGVVNFGDNGNPQTEKAAEVSHTAVPYWIANHKADGKAQWLGNQLTGIHNQWSLIWYNPEIKAQQPKPGNRLWRSDLDWIVARTGFTANDLVVAMRSGGPANHEHADRNSLIVKCYGEQLVTDPNRPPYSFADPAWSMRLTQGHSAVLIDGAGHQHHNGVEGTNASNAHARIVQTNEHAQFAWWISDASQAYRLVDSEIKSVVRGVVVFYDAPAVLVVDRVTKWQKPSGVQARFFGYNWDNQLRHEISNEEFEVVRPNATLSARVFCRQPVTVSASRLDIPVERAQRHPFIAVDAAPSLDTTLITVLAMSRAGREMPKLQFVQENNQVVVAIQKHGQKYQCEISEEGILPVFNVKS